MPRVTARLLGAVLAFGVVLFVSVTQTQVGREQLRRQLVAGFDRQFEGRLHIGRLRGTLVGTLIADDVALVAPSGDTVVVARRVVATPAWSFGRTNVALRDLHATGLDVRAVRDTAGRWNVAEVFRRRAPVRPRATPTGPPRWRLGTPRLVLSGARVRVADRTPRPAAVARGQVFDALNTVYTDLDAALLVRGRASDRWIRIDRLDGDVPQQRFTLDGLSGTVRLADSLRAVHDLRLTAGATRLRGRVEARAGQPVDVHVEGQADFDALRRLVPALPVAGTAALTLDGDVRTGAEGTFDAHLATLRFDAEGVRVHTQGRIAQRADSLVFAADSLDVRASAVGARALLPRLPARALAILEPGLNARLGPTTLRTLRGTSAFDVRTAGRVRHGDAALDVARLDASRSPGGVLRWDARLAADRLDLAPYLPNHPASLVSGQIDTRGEAGPLDGRGFRAGALTIRTAEARVRLGPSRVWGRALDSLRLDLATAGTTVRARGHVAPSGAGSATFDLDGTPTQGNGPHRVAGTLGFQRFDAAGLGLPGDLSTRLTGTATLDASGRTARDLVGQIVLALEDGYVRLGRESVTLADARVQARRTAAGALTLEADVRTGSGTVRGVSGSLRGARVTAEQAASGALALALRLADGRATVQGTPVVLRDADARLTRLADGTLRLDGTTPQGRFNVQTRGDVARLRPLADAYRTRLAAYLESRLPPSADTLGARSDGFPLGADTLALLPALPPLRLPAQAVQLEGTLTLLDTALVRRFVPGLRAAGLDVAFALAASPQALDLHADVRADSLAHPRANVRGLSARLDLSDDGTPRLRATATAQRLAAGALRADDARLAAALDGAHAKVDLFALRRFDPPAEDARTGAGQAEQRVADALAEDAIDLDALDEGVLAGVRRDSAALAAAADAETLRPDTLRLAFDATRRAHDVAIRLHRLDVSAGSLRLSAASARLVAYRDALVLPEPLELTGAAVAGLPQVLRVSGIASRRSQDTLRLDAERVTLAPLLSATPLRRRLDGTLDAQLAVAAALARPDLTGDFALADLRLQPLVDGLPKGDAVVLGDLGVEIGYVQGDSTGQVAAALVPTGGSTSRAHGQGTFRLPQGGRAGSLDFAAELERLDAALLDALVPALFSGTRGSAHGLLTLQGDLRRPDYAADLVLDSARTTMPLLGTTARATGFVRLTPQGIALRDLRATDPTGGQIRVDGSLDGPIGRPPTLNLAVRMDEFRIVHLPAATDFPIYGDVWLTGTASVKGPPRALRIVARGVQASPRTSVFIPLRASGSTSVAAGYITFLDTLGLGPVYAGRRALRPGVGLSLDLDVTAPSGTGFNLAFDPLVGDVMRARGSGRLQLRLDDGAFAMYGGVDIEGGDYLFTAGDVFVRRFVLDGGRIDFDGPPTNAQLAIQASYRTRASLAGLPLAADARRLVPLVVRMDVTERLSAPRVDLTLALDRSRDARASAAVENFETLVNQPERQAEYATSVLLTNSFLLTSQAAEQTGLAESGNQLAFASLSQLVASQLNRYLADVLPGVELTLGLQGTRTSALDVTYGVALRLLDDRLTVRGQGVLSTDAAAATDALQGEFVVEVRLSPVVSVEAFYRREDDLLESVASGTLTNTAGAALSYRTRFTTWRQFWDRLRGRD